MRKLKVKLEEVLHLIVCAEDYGHASEVLHPILAGWIGDALTDDEIESSAASYLTPEMRTKGYGEEDADETREKLRAWRSRYQDGGAS